MARASIVPYISSLLEPYLERIDANWSAQPETARTPTLPHLDDGKVNVRAITLALGLKQTQEQHFFKQRQLASAVNAVAEIQGLKPIGSRALIDADDKVAAERIAAVSSERDELAKALAEALAAVEELRKKNASLSERLALRDETGLVFRGEFD